MADLNDVISAAVADSHPASDTADSLDTAADTADTAETPAADAIVTPETTTVTPPEQDELAQILEENGFKPAKAGERENRIPYGRTKKIIGNALKKQAEAHTAAIKDWESKAAAAQKRLENYDAADNLAKTNPDQYLQLLSVLHPEYRQYTKAQKAEARAEAKQVVQGNDPRPGPDATFADGTKGYSPEGFAAVLDWNGRQVEARVTAKLNEDFAKRLGPIEQERQSAAFINEKMPIVRGQIAAAKDTWGKLFTDHEPEILKVMQANDGEQGRPFMSFDACIARVLVPKAQANRDSMRTDLLKEINARPAAAAKTTPGAVSAGGDSGAPRTMEDIIRGAVATLK